MTTETDDQDPDTYPIEELAKWVLALGIQAVIPSAIRAASASAALTAVLAKIREQLDVLKGRLAQRKGLHELLLKGSTPSTLQKVTAVAGLLTPGMQIPTLVDLALNPAKSSVVGAAVQALNPASTR